MRMRICISVLVALGQLTAAPAPTVDKSFVDKSWNVQVFFGPGAAYKVTITRKHAVLATIEVPRGALLSVYGDQRPIISATRMRFEFSGEVVIRTRPWDLSVSGIRPNSMVMADAPMITSVRDVEVTVEQVGE